MWLVFFSLVLDLNFFSPLFELLDVFSVGRDFDLVDSFFCFVSFSSSFESARVFWRMDLILPPRVDPELSRRTETAKSETKSDLNMLHPCVNIESRFTQCFFYAKP